MNTDVLNPVLAPLAAWFQQLPVSFLWPQMLWLLLALPLLVLLYLWLLSRRRKSAVRLASLSIVREAAGRGPGWRRHLPPVLLLLAVAASLLAASRPVATLRLPSTQQTIILAMDVSGSMRAEDVQPNRLVASQNAAKAFLAELPRHVKVGIVAFAGSAQVVQPPTLSRDDLVAAIDRFQLQRATAIGSAIVVSLAEIFPDQNISLGDITYQRNTDPFAPKGRAIDRPAAQVWALAGDAPRLHEWFPGIVASPVRDAGVKHVEFVALGHDQALAVLVGDDGTIENRLMPLSAGVTPSTLTEASNFLNARLKGRPLHEARTEMRTELDAARRELDAAAARLVEDGMAAWSGGAERERSLIVRGRANLLHDRIRRKNRNPRHPRRGVIQQSPVRNPRPQNLIPIVARHRQLPAFIVTHVPWRRTN
mgnify:CR=1 FL=1